MLAYVSVFAISVGLSVLLLPQAFVSTAIALVVGAIFFCILQDKTATSPAAASSESVSPLPVNAHVGRTNETAVMSPLLPRAPPRDHVDTSPPAMVLQDDQIQLAKEQLSDSHIASTNTPSTLAAAASPRSDISADSDCLHEHALLSIYPPHSQTSAGNWLQCTVAFSCQAYWKLDHHAASPPPALDDSPAALQHPPAPQSTTELQFSAPQNTDVPIAPCSSHADAATSTASEWSRALHDISAAVPPHISVLESFVSSEVQAGYVEQISPDCAAAAAAGAINALLSIPADSPQTQSQHAALKAYASMFQTAKDAAVARFTKALSKEANAEAILEHVLLLSRTFCTAWSALSAAALRKQLLHALQPHEQQQGAARDCAAFSQKLTCATPWSDLVVAGLKTIVKADAAIAKLMAERPSTAPISNKKLSLCVRGAAAAAGFAVQASTFFSKNPCSSSRYLVSPADSEETMQEQWESLRLAVMQPNTVLLFHLRNHYALIAGYRTLRLPCGAVLQQLLCSRKGQRPKHWIDWRCSWMEGDVPRWSVRDTLLKWIGYKIIMVKRARAGFVDKDTASIAAVADAFASWRAENGAAAEFRGVDGDNLENVPCDSEAVSEEEDAGDGAHGNKDEQGSGLHLKKPQAFRGLKAQVGRSAAAAACSEILENDAQSGGGGIDAAASIISFATTGEMLAGECIISAADQAASASVGSPTADLRDFDCVGAESFDAQGESEVLVAYAAEADAAAQAQDAPASASQDSSVQGVAEQEATVGDEVLASGKASVEPAVADAASPLPSFPLAQTSDCSSVAAQECSCAGIEPIGLVEPVRAGLSVSVTSKGLAAGVGKPACSASSGRVKFGVANIVSVFEVDLVCGLCLALLLRIAWFSFISRICAR